MKRMYQFTLATAIIFTLVVSTSHLAYAQANDIDGGPLGKGDLLKIQIPTMTI